MTAHVKILAVWNDGENVEVLNEFDTYGKPPYGMGHDRDPLRATFCCMPFDAPATPERSWNGHVNGEHQLMIWYDYDPNTREVKCFTIPPKGRIEISVLEA